jgi:hypothetical protein
MANFLTSQKVGVKDEKAVQLRSGQWFWEGNREGADFFVKHP